MHINFSDLIIKMQEQLEHPSTVPDETLLMELIQRIRPIDCNNSNEIQEKILDGMKENSETVTTGKEYLLTLVYLERITGYAVNLCEWIVYLNSGNIIEL